MNATHWKSGLCTRAALAALLATGAACVDAGDDNGAIEATSDRAERAQTGRGLTPNTQFFIPAPNAGASRQVVDLIKSRSLKDALRIAALETTPQAVWFADGTPDDVRSAVRKTMREAKEQRRVPILVV